MKTAAKITSTSTRANARGRRIGDARTQRMTMRATVPPLIPFFLSVRPISAAVILLSFFALRPLSGDHFVLFSFRFLPVPLLGELSPILLPFPQAVPDGFRQFFRRAQRFQNLFLILHAGIVQIIVIILGWLPFAHFPEDRKAEAPASS